MSNFKMEQVHESVMNLVGKNIFHCKDTNMLFWCDVLGGCVFKMDLNNNNKICMFKLLGEKVICFCIPIHGKKDQFIVGAGRRLLLVQWDGMSTMGQIMKVVGEVPVNGVRMNGCRVDKQGRLFFGTMICEEQGDFFNMQKRVGCLYRFTMHDGLVQLKDNVGLGNGIVFNNMYNKMYFIDSYDLNVYEFDYDLKTGNISE
jgi:gluconolactonase